jgi:NADH dehydrogenase
MTCESVCILGGSGFVGMRLANRLAAGGRRIRVLTRRRERHRQLLVIPTLECLEADVHDAQALEAALRGCDAAVNLVGILNERRDDGAGFRRVHVDLTAKVLGACRRAGVTRLLHMSALNADRQAPSHYLRSKGEAEQQVLEADGTGLRCTVFRPSVIFGPGDGFFNRFASLLRLTPLVFPLACARSRFAPVFVGDVAEAFARALDDPATFGRRYELCGPEVFTLEDIVRYTAGLLGLRRAVLPLPDVLARAQARLLEFVPGKPFSRDNYRSLQVDSVCSGTGGLQAFGIVPTAVTAIVPRYLPGPRPGGRYGRTRARAGRA